MSWPTRTWTVDGWKDFKTPGPSATPKGLPDDWKQHKSSIDHSNFWDVIENPLYEAAANAIGLDWDQFVADSLAEIGSREDYAAALGYVNRSIHSSTAGGMLAPGTVFDPSYVEDIMLGRDPNKAWNDLTPKQQAIAENLPRGNSTSDPAMPGAMAGMGLGGGVPTLMGNVNIFDLAGKDYEPPRNWGIHRGKFGSIAEDLDSMHEWLGKTIKTHALQDAPIIRRGPEGSDYGIDGDIWEHYGLGQKPQPPKEMDVNYEFNLIAAKPSHSKYATPKGYPTLDTSTESIPYEDTHYAK